MMNRMLRTELLQGGIFSEILFNFYLIEAISDISKLPAGWTSNCSKVNILGYDDVLILVAPTAQASNFLLNVPTSKHYKMSLQVNVKKSCNIVVRHSNKVVSTSMTMSNQLLSK